MTRNASSGLQRSATTTTVTYAAIPRPTNGSDPATSTSGAGPVDISVVIPCLNEEEAVGRVVDMAFEGIRASGRSGEVIVVDNGSDDASVEIAARHGARVVHQPHRGYGHAYLAGFRAAQGRYIVMGDADGTYDFRDLEGFLSPLAEGADLVMGSRRHDGRKKAMPWSHRWIGNPLLTFMVNRLFKVRVSDACCGMRSLKRESLSQLALQSSGMEFALEMLFKAARNHLNIVELQIDYHPRLGESKLRSVRDGWRSVKFILLSSPSYLFFVPAAMLLVPGLLGIFAFAGGPIHALGRTWQVHTMIFFSVLALLGAQIAQFGSFARTLATVHMGERDPLLERIWRRVSLKHGIAVGAIGISVGGAVLLVLFTRWALGGFGEVHSEYVAVLSLTLAGLGVQTLFSSFLISIIGRGDFGPATGRLLQAEVASRLERQP